MNVIAETEQTLPTFQEGLKWYWKTRPILSVIRWFYPIFGSLMLFLALINLSSSKMDHQGALGLIVFGALFLSVMPLQRWRFRRLTKQQPNYGKTALWTFGDNSVHVEVGADNSTITYPSFFRIRTTADGLLLMQNASLFLWIPARTFKGGTAFEEVRHHLETTAGAQRLR